jgi:hypothetical protein
MSIYGQPFLALTATLVLVLSIIWGWTTRTTSDFHVFYQSAVDLRHGVDPYVSALGWGMPNANPPALMLFLLPFAWLSMGAAFVVWTAIGLGAFVWSAWLVARETGRSLWTILLVACSTQGLAVTVNSGQLTLFLTPILTLAWLADRRNDSRAGLWLGTLFYLKPFFGLFALYLLWRRSYRTLGIAIASMATWAVVGLVVGGIGVHRSWLASVAHVNRFEANVLNASLGAIPARLFNTYYPDAMTHYTAIVDWPALGLWTWIALSLTVVAVAARVLPRRSRDAQWALLCLTSLAVSPLGWIYYVPMLVGPLAAVWRRPFVVPAMVSAVPAVWLLAQHFGVFGTLTTGSAFTWAVFLAWAAVLRDPDEIAKAKLGRTV